MTLYETSKIGALVCITLILLLAGCAAPIPDTDRGDLVIPTATQQGQEGEPQQDTDAKLAQVENVETLILESFPVQVRALVKGNLADGCTEIEQIEETRDVEGKSFKVKITTFRDPDKMCTQALVPFEETVALDVRDLPAGAYTIEVNGIQAGFELQQDNKAP